MSDIPVAYEQALAIARSQGFPRNGFWFKDVDGTLIPNLRTKLFAKYFFKSDEDFEAFNKSDDPLKFIQDYIDKHYKDEPHE